MPWLVSLLWRSLSEGSVPRSARDRDAARGRLNA
jgi:hypothetical protein